MCLFMAGLSLTAQAEHHESPEAEVRGLVEAFNNAYATNDADTYFSFYAPDSTIYFYGARQDVAAYDEEWHAMIDAGGGVEKNDISDVRLQVLAGGSVVVATYFVDNRSRSPDGQVSSAKAFETDVWEMIDGEWKIVSLHYTEIAPAE
jgi:ketosteroid isomerase-like protein